MNFSASCRINVTWSHFMKASWSTDEPFSQSSYKHHLVTFNESILFSLWIFQPTVKHNAKYWNLLLVYSHLKTEYNQESPKVTFLCMYFHYRHVYYKYLFTYTYCFMWRPWCGGYCKIKILGDSSSIPKQSYLPLLCNLHTHIHTYSINKVNFCLRRL